MFLQRSWYVFGRAHDDVAEGMNDVEGLSLSSAVQRLYQRRGPEVDQLGSPKVPCGVGPRVPEGSLGSSLCDVRGLRPW
jgi:hypothetical protein